MKRIALVTFILISLASVFPQTAVEPALGDGTSANPYQIANLENLYWIAAPDSVVPAPDHISRLSSHYVQVSDINASETETWFGGRGWLPIGNYISDYFGNPVLEESFNGVYDGKDHAIVGLYLNRNETSLGMFEFAMNTANIRDLNLTDINFTGLNYVGGIAGLIFCDSDNAGNVLITGCSVSGSIVGSNFLGGIAASSYGASISNCFNMSAISGIVPGTYTGTRIGGITSEISRVFNDQNIYTKIERCYNTGSVSGTSSVGGIAGNNQHSYITDCYNSGSISGDQYVGGLVGLHEQYIAYFDTCIGLWNSYNTGAVNGTNYTGTIVGYNNDSNIYKCFWDSETSVTEIGVGGKGTMTQPATAYGKTTAQMKTLSTFTGAGWNFDSVWLIDPLLNDGYPDLQWQYPPPASPEVLLSYSSSPDLSWNAVSGATSYKIYSSPDPYAVFPSGWILETTVTEQTWSDQNATGTKMFYLVIAVK